jgi:predicted TIM-barrel fold metal-dependent hydrolase
MELIDPHCHLFALKHGDYHWLKPESPPFWTDKPLIAKECSQADLQLPEHLSLAAIVHVEAGFDNQAPWRELAHHEDTLTLSFKSIATCDLRLGADAFAEQIKRLQQQSSFVGVRHILDADAASLLSDDTVQENLRLLASKSLLFEAQFSACDREGVDQVCTFLSETPYARWVLNHQGFAPFANCHGDTQQRGLAALERLSECPNLTVKASGWEMQQRHFCMTDVFAQIERVVALFGHDRVMIASNFPLLTWRMSYAEYWQQITQEYANTPELFYANAQRLYFE